ncbi:MAG: DUF421 domain-containing protein [Corallococcus sp.]|nr:DUF421 domain-containing protein [Corallococcus sp.]
MNDILKVVLFSALSYATLFVISKLLGKKQIAELDFIDYVTGISIGSIAAEMATETDIPFYYYLIAMGIFFLFDIVVTLLGRKSNCFKRFLRGVPLIIVNRGEVDFKALKKSKIDFYDLVGLAREKGYFDISEIEYAVFETNGELSILASDKSRQLKREDFPSIPEEKTELTSYLIVDGQISSFALNQINRDKKWLKSQLQEQDVELGKILYATYDEDTRKLNVTEKKSQS